MKTIIPDNNASSMKRMRRWHRASAGILFLTLVIIASTGLLLGWKKNSSGYLHPDTYYGTNAEMCCWLPLDSLHSIALQVLHDSINPNLRTELDRIDVRPDAGMVKFVFRHHYNGIQLDAATGRVLHLERRRSDIIEDIHDGSAMDKLFGTSGEQIKVVYTTINGLALLVFSITGFLIWVNSRKRTRNNRV